MMPCIRAWRAAIAETWGDLPSRIAILIAATASAAALAAWAAALAETETTQHHLEAVQEFIAQTMWQQLWEWRTEQDRRLLPRFQEHIRAWRWYEQAARASRGDRASLDLDAQAELAAARALVPFFKETPDFGDASGAITMDTDRWLNRQLLNDQDLRRLHPELTEGRAARVHTRTLALLLIGVLFAASLVGLTVAELTDSPARRVLADLGAAVLVLGGIGGFLAMRILR